MPPRAPGLQGPAGCSIPTGPTGPAVLVGVDDDPKALLPRTAADLLQVLQVLQVILTHPRMLDSLASEALATQIGTMQFQGVLRICLSVFMPLPHAFLLSASTLVCCRALTQPLKDILLLFVAHQPPS